MAGDPTARSRRGAVLAAAATALLLAPLAWAAESRGAGGLATQALVVYAVGVALVLRGLRWHAPVDRFGAANRVTLCRFGLVALLAAAALHPAALQQHVFAWTVAIVAAVAAAMDALDGALARAQGTASDFGARFDMEVDAFTVMVLATLALQAGKAGPWVLACGALRYVFVGASACRPWLNRPLPPSLRRKAVCAVQVSALVVCLVPFVPTPWAAASAAAGLTALAWSFAIDVAWLVRVRQRPMEPLR